MKMTTEEAISQLNWLRGDRESLCNGNPDDDEIWNADIEAIDVALKQMQENAELKRLLKLAAAECVPDICDYCIYDGSKRCVEENAELECGNMACQFAYWRHYDELKGLLEIAE